MTKQISLPEKHFYKISSVARKKVIILWSFSVYQIKILATLTRSSSEKHSEPSPAWLLDYIWAKVQIAYILFPAQSFKLAFNSVFFTSLWECGSARVSQGMLYNLSALAVSSFSNVIALCGLLEPAFAGLQTHTLLI